MRKIALGLALSSVLASNSHAVGLGEIVTNSSLNQPLNASIELVDTSPGDIDDLEVTLAPSAVFDQVGISRSSALDKLEFIPTIENGVPTIKVTSLQPIQEPFLNFVLEVTWANGKLLREYTVLLDPPVFSDTQYAATDSGVTAEPVIEEMPVATAIDEMAAPEVEALPGVAAEGLDPFVSIPDTQVATVDDLGTAESIETYEGLETYPVEGEIAEPVAIEEIDVTEVAPEIAATDIGEGLDPFVDGAPLESAYADDLAPTVEEISYNDYPIEESLPVEDIVMEVEPDLLEGTDEIFVAEADVLPADGTDEIFVSSPAPVAGGDSYTVTKGDTLSSIARQFADGASVSQMMVAMMRSNPNAFINNNMNLIKSGYVLRVPDPAEAASIPQREALAEIAKNNAAWGKYRSDVASNPLPQLSSERLAGIEDLVGLDRGDIATVPEVEVVVETTEVVAEIEDLVAPETGLEIIVPDEQGDSIEGSADTGTGAIGNVEKELALAKEQLVSSSKENAELRSRVAELESLLASKNRLIELKNEQLADLQKQMAAVAPEGDADKSMVEQATDAASNAADKAAETAKGLLPRAEMDDKPAPEAPVETEQAAEQADAAQTTLTDEPVKEAKKPESSGELLDDVKNNPNLLMGLGFGGLLLAALGWLVLRRKDGGEYEPPAVATPVSPTMGDSEEEKAEDSEPAKETAESAEETLTELETLQEEEPKLGETAVADAEEDALPESSFEAESVSDETEDEVMSEANVYLAYGLEDQAIEVLEPAVKAHPERTDYAVKLLEAYHSTKNTEAFESLAEKVAGQIEDKENSEEWKKIAVMGKALVPGAALFAAVDTGDLSMTQIKTRPPEIADIDMNPDDSSVENSLLNTVSEMDTGEVETAELDADSLEEAAGELQDELSEAIDSAESELDMGDISEAVEDNQVAEINASELGDLGAELEGEFDSNIDLSGDDVVDKLQHTQIELEKPDLDDLGDIELDTGDLEIEDLKLGDAESIVEPSEVIEAAKDDATISIPMEERLNLDALVGDEGPESLFSTGEDEISTKLDLAKAYLDMGDDEGAREALEEVISMGSPAQRDEAEKLKAQLD